MPYEIQVRVKDPASIPILEAALGRKSRPVRPPGLEAIAADIHHARGDVSFRYFQPAAAQQAMAILRGEHGELLDYCSDPEGTMLAPDELDPPTPPVPVVAVWDQTAEGPGGWKIYDRAEGVDAEPYAYVPVGQGMGVRQAGLRAGELAGLMELRLPLQSWEYLTRRSPGEYEVERVLVGEPPMQRVERFLVCRVGEERTVCAIVEVPPGFPDFTVVMERGRRAELIANLWTMARRMSLLGQHLLLNCPRPD